MQERAAGLLAGPAGGCANPAVLVHSGMGVAFFGADPTDLGTRHQLGLDQHRAWFRQPRDNARRDQTDVRAVQTGADATDEVGHVRLAEACVGASGACASARVAGRGTRLYQTGVRGALGVRGEQRDQVFHDVSSQLVKDRLSGPGLAPETFGADRLRGQMKVN